MKLSNLINELEKTENYKQFKEQNPSTFFAAGFFILDLKNNSNQIQLDYFLPEQNKMASFEHPFKEVKIHDDEIKNLKPQDPRIKIDIDDLENKSNQILKENKAFLIPTKLIAIIKENIWNITTMDDMLGIITLKLNADSGETKDFKKGSIMDIVKVKKG